MFDHFMQEKDKNRSCPSYSDEVYVSVDSCKLLLFTVYYHTFSLTYFIPSFTVFFHTLLETEVASSNKTMIIVLKITTFCSESVDAFLGSVWL